VSQPKFKHPNFSRTSVRRLVANEDSIRAAPGSKRLAKMVLQRQGMFPDMERALDNWITNTRASGIPIQFWMLSMQGEKILKRLRPKQFDDAGVCQFKFSNNWARAFMRRHRLSMRKMTHRSKSNPNSINNLEIIATFHRDTRLLQLSETNDPVYGLAPAFAVFNRDQVPIELLGEGSRTVDSEGARHVWVGVGDESDSKRFCSLDLMIPMEVLPDFSNLPKPHVVFRATSFKTAADWVGLTTDGRLERDCWHPNVTVSFQKCAWVDTQTNVYGMQQLAGLRDVLIQKGAKVAVKFEDNQSAHKTDQALASMERFLANWIQVLYPPNLTHCLQPVDRHIGIQYKRDVYDAVRAELLRRMEAAGDGVPVPLTACDKRILVTQAIGSTHARLAAKGFMRAFVATATWLPIDGGKDAEVDLQNVDRYDYQTCCTAAAIASQKVLREEQALAKALQEQAAAAANRAAEAQRVADEKV
jgi:hypothetical protein